MELECESRQSISRVCKLNHIVVEQTKHTHRTWHWYIYSYVIDPPFPLRDARLAKRYFQYRMISTKREGSTRGFKGRRSSKTPSFMPLVECELSCSVMSLEPHGLYHIRLLCPWNFLGKNTGVGCHFLFKEVFLTQGSNPCLLRLLHWQVGSLPLRPLCPSPPNNPVTQWW